jgi:hypothetical protein
MIVIEITPSEYEYCLSRIPPDNSAHPFLERATFGERRNNGHFSEIYRIACVSSEAKLLLAAAKQFCPGIASKIEAAMKAGPSSDDLAST